MKKIVSLMFASAMMLFAQGQGQGQDKGRQ